MRQIQIWDEVKQNGWVLLAAAVLIGIVAFALSTGGFMS